MAKEEQNRKFSVIVLIVALLLLLSALTRIILLLGTHASGVSVTQFSASLFIGILYDLSVASFVIIPFVLHVWLQNNFIYRRSVFPFVCLLFAGVLALLLFTNIIPKDYNTDLYNILIYYIAARFAIYVFLYLMPYSFRIRWRTGVLYVSTALVVFVLLFNAVAEWAFWQEFSTRYNFIAVDYLVYTTEVLGNITESYPLVPILSTAGVLTIVIVFLLRKPIRASVVSPFPFVKRSAVAISLLLMPLLVYYAVQEKWRHFSRNEYANSLAGNGLYEFAVAFTQNELDFYKFYQTIPDTTAFSLLRKQLATPNSHFVSNDPYSIEREIAYPGPERKLNVVLISVESLSASFMHAFGGNENITPFLDSLAQHSLLFTNLYSSGTRTVRGLEALSLSIPPTPGQSIVKRPDNGHLFSLGSVLRSHGYTTQYIYGGYSYFDNMKEFFSHNGYSVIDRSAIPADQVHYQNIWGVADEDLFDLSLHVLDKDNQAGKPFFAHIMTVSNHRPFTYPDGRIDIPAARQVREGAVKYTDYAINKFLRDAQHKPWYDSTVFVIVADHCAGSAGSVELPVTGYHIPMLIYAPKILQPREVNTLTAQIDVAPTILGLMNLHYRSKFFGQDVLHMPAEKERAFISTYQGLGYLRNGKLLVQSPVKNIQEYLPDFKNGNETTVQVEGDLANEAIAYYQSISWLLKHRRQME
ncbi:LTA synthase family protein [Chitinophaga ginsengisoli]|uniref:Phosphoglycerol transferase MdoB-like AlkP superfamily enzyme n=1 Tax=Chitinophaga ginsengisoli TaxID=363837 RepID=A0A2P8GL60_9BACT|nr:LTA synthase family protein [Chitinophaga ginsengisoli]PSL34680.1 phosphoglycerol transferase MdoB-like AlkP superfamily enzyme [Chitinophaga ginsengisoli]